MDFELTLNHFKKEFLDHIEAELECGYLEYIFNFEQKFDENILKICTNLSATLQKLISEYEKQKKSMFTDELAEVYVSYLRTQILNCSSNYRIDFYDKRGIVSENECEDYWNIDAILIPFYDIFRQSEVKFKSQSRAGLYELENMMLSKADDLQSIIKKFMPKVFEYYACHFEDSKYFSQNKVKIFFGELYDHSELIFNWSGI